MRTLARGRPRSVQVFTVRELTARDLETHFASGARHSSSVASFRDTHHRLARLFATGLRSWEVAERSGYSYGRVCQMHGDPAFQELIAVYRAKLNEEWASRGAEEEFATLAQSNMVKAERRLADALDDDDLEIPVNRLVAIAADRMDRFGFGKRSTQVNLNVDFAAQLDKAIERSGVVVDGRPRLVSSQPTQSGGVSQSLPHSRSGHSTPGGSPTPAGPVKLLRRV